VITSFRHKELGSKLEKYASSAGVDGLGHADVSNRKSDGFGGMGDHDCKCVSTISRLVAKGRFETKKRGHQTLGSKSNGDPCELQGEESGAEGRGKDAGRQKKRGKRQSAWRKKEREKKIISEESYKGRVRERKQTKEEGGFHSKIDLSYHSGRHSQGSYRKGLSYRHSLHIYKGKIVTPPQGRASGSPSRRKGGPNRKGASELGKRESN